MRLVFLHPNGSRLTYAVADPVDGRCEVVVTYPDGDTERQVVPEDEVGAKTETLQRWLAHLGWSVEPESGVPA